MKSSIGSEVVTLIGAAVLLSIAFYYYVGGTSYLTALTGGIATINEGLLNFQHSYPTP